MSKEYTINCLIANWSHLAGGNDTIDRYPPACGEIAKILCVTEAIFKRIQRDYRDFLKDNRPTKPKRAKTRKPKVKPKTYTPKPSAVEPAASNLDDLYLHRLGRLKDWNGLYGQGMYE